MANEVDVAGKQYDVGRDDQALQGVPTRGSGVVEGHGAFPGAHEGEERTDFYARCHGDERGVPSGDAATGGLDQYDVGAELDQDATGVGQGLAGQIEDPEPPK